MPENRRVMMDTMKKWLLIWVCLLWASPALAQRGGRITAELGELEWGMSPRAVFKHFVQDIRVRFEEERAKLHDPVQQDHLYQTMKNRVREIRRTYVAFDGDPSGWDVSFLEGEFTHRNDEAMLVVKSERSKNYYFFIDGKLWKEYRVFDARDFGNHNFRSFARAMLKRFGRGRVKKGVLHEGQKPRAWVEWRDRSTRLRAVDQTSFYGFYCLVFESRKTLKALPSLREHVAPRERDTHPAVAAVVGNETEVTFDDRPGRAQGRGNTKDRKKRKAKGKDPFDGIKF